MTLAEIEKAVNFIRVSAKPITIKPKIDKETISIKRIKERYIIANKFNYDISLKGIVLNDNVLNFITNHNLVIDETKTRLMLE